MKKCEETLYNCTMYHLEHFEKHPLDETAAPVLWSMLWKQYRKEKICEKA